jgi:hypothetical protein
MRTEQHIFYRAWWWGENLSIWLSPVKGSGVRALNFPVSHHHHTFTCSFPLSLSQSFDYLQGIIIIWVQSFVCSGGIWMQCDRKQEVQVGSSQQRCTNLHFLRWSCGWQQCSAGPKGSISCHCGDGSVGSCFLLVSLSLWNSCTRCTMWELLGPHWCP